MGTRHQRKGRSSSDPAVVLGWTILGLVALVAIFAMIGGFAGPPTHVSAVRIATASAFVGTEFLVGLGLVRQWQHFGPIATGVSSVVAVGSSTAAVRLFAHPGSPGPEGGPYRAALAFALVAVFQISVAAVLIKNARK